MSPRLLGALLASLALTLAGITRGTPNPPGGEIVRDQSGEPTGVLLESAMELVEKVLRSLNGSRYQLWEKHHI